MMKKGLLMSFLMASLVLTTAICLSSCKKNESNKDIPTSVETITPEDGGLRAVCPHCHQHIYVGDAHHYHEYAVDSLCGYGIYCEWYGRHHSHEVWVSETLDPNTNTLIDHYEHLGGGGEGGN